MLVYPQSFLFNLLIIKLQSSLFVYAVFSANIAPFNRLLHYLSCLVQFLCMPLNFLSCFKQNLNRGKEPLSYFQLICSYFQMVILSLILKRARIKALVKDKRSTEEAFGTYVEVTLYNSHIHLQHSGCFLYILTC